MQDIATRPLKFIHLVATSKTTGTDGNYGVLTNADLSGFTAGFITRTITRYMTENPQDSNISHQDIDPAIERSRTVKEGQDFLAMRLPENIAEIALNMFDGSGHGSGHIKKAFANGAINFYSVREYDDTIANVKTEGHPIIIKFPFRPTDSEDAVKQRWNELMAPANIYIQGNLRKGGTSAGTAAEIYHANAVFPEVHDWAAIIPHLRRVAKFYVVSQNLYDAFTTEWRFHHRVALESRHRRHRARLTVRGYRTFIFHRVTVSFI